MSEEKKHKKQSLLDNLNIFKKIKQVKNIGLIITIIFVLILLIILFGNFDFMSLSSSVKTDGSTYTVSTDYLEKMEAKLTDVLTKIKGAGDVKVMITLESGTTVVVTSDDELKIITIDDAGKQSVSTVPVVLSNKNFEVSSEIIPMINGVVIVSSGATNVNVKLNLYTATKTLLDLPAEKIQIFEGN